MAGDPPKRSDDETEAEIVKRRVIDAVREQVDEIRKLTRKELEAEAIGQLWYSLGGVGSIPRTV